MILLLKMKEKQNMQNNKYIKHSDKTQNSKVSRKLNYKYIQQTRPHVDADIITHTA